MNNISYPGLAVAYGSSARALQGLHLPAWLLALCCLFTLVSSPTFAEDEGVFLQSLFPYPLTPLLLLTMAVRVGSAI